MTHWRDIKPTVVVLKPWDKEQYDAMMESFANQPPMEPPTFCMGVETLAQYKETERHVLDFFNKRAARERLAELKRSFVKGKMRKEKRPGTLKKRDIRYLDFNH